MTRALADVRNAHAVVRILRLAKPSLPPPRWHGSLAEPVQPMDTHTRMRAVSLLFGIEFQDGSRHPDTLTLD